MKVVVVNFSETKGGAAKAAKRLHNALLKNGIDSTFLTQFKETTESSVIGNTSKLAILKAKLAVKKEEIPVKKYKNKSVTPFSSSFTGSSGIVKKINKLNPDIVHLHWINAGMLSIDQIDKINAPIVWSLHDMWAFTGGCHYTEGCNKFTEQCGSCKVLNSKDDSDLSRKIYLKKQKIFSDKTITIVGLSQWIANAAKESSLLKNQPIVNIPNPIDTELFYQIGKEKARKHLGLPLDKKIILFGAMGPSSDPRKGYSYLIKALDFLNDVNIELLIFGTNDKLQHPKFNTNVLGFVLSEEKLNLIYNAADVIIVPSIQENLSNTIVEGLATGTPVVAFDIGGNSDMIEHKKNGYLAKPFLSEDLAMGIQFVLDQTTNAMNRAARKKIETTFSQDIVGSRYIELYNQILQ